MNKDHLLKLKKECEETLANTCNMLDTTPKISLSFLSACYNDFEKALYLGCSEELITNLAEKLLNKEVIAFTSPSLEAVKSYKDNISFYLNEHKNKTL